MKGEVTIIGDPHTKHNNLIEIKELFAIVEELGNTAIWMGDILDTKEVIRGKCLNLLYEQFKLSKLQHYILIGNHDWFNDDCRDHSLKTLGQLSNVVLIEEAVSNGCVGMMPFYGSLKKFERDVKVLTTRDIKYLFIHQGITGFDYGNGRIARDEVSEKLIQECNVDLVISGHFHKYQEKGKLIYIGTPFSHSFGEANQKKYIGVLNLDTGKFETLETEFPSHLSFEVDASKASQVKKIKQKLQELSEGSDHVRVILMGPTDKVAEFPKESYPTVKFIDRPTSFAIASVLMDTQTPEEQFTKWATEIKQLDKDTIKLGLELLRAA